MDHQAISDSDVENLKIVVISKSEIVMSLQQGGHFHHISSDAAKIRHIQVYIEALKKQNCLVGPQFFAEQG